MCVYVYIYIYVYMYFLILCWICLSDSTCQLRTCSDCGFDFWCNCSFLWSPPSFRSLGYTFLPLSLHFLWRPLRLGCTASDALVGSLSKTPFSEMPSDCWEFHDQLWEVLSGTTSEKRSVLSRNGGERILEMLWKPQMPWIMGLGVSQPYSQGEFQQNLWERFRGLSGLSSSRTGGMANLQSLAGHLLRTR